MFQQVANIVFTACQCPYCGKTFKTNSKLLLCVHVHTGAKPHSCRHCSDSFMQFGKREATSTGVTHLAHLWQMKFICSYHYKLHIQWYGGEKPYVCSKGPKHFYTSSALKRHQLVISLPASYVVKVSGISRPFSTLYEMCFSPYTYISYELMLKRFTKNCS